MSHDNVTLSWHSVPLRIITFILRHLRTVHSLHLKTFVQRGNMYNSFRMAVLFLAALTAFGGTKVAPDLPQSNPNAVVDVIVQFKTVPSKDELKQLGPYGQVKN